MTNIKTKNYQILHGYLFYQQLKQLNPTTLRGNQLPAALHEILAKYIVVCIFFYEKLAYTRKK